MAETEPTSTAISAIVQELVRSGPLAAILFLLLRDQMNKFDKFLTVIDALREALTKQTTTIELLTSQCRMVQTEAETEKKLAELRRTLLAEGRGSKGGQGDGGE